MEQVYNIIELANSHGGDYNYATDLISAFEGMKNGFGMKFQPFKYDRIATDDFASYDVYKKLFFSKSQWHELIRLAVETKDVWLDLFDTYGVEVLKENINLVHGIKFQSSVLYNFEVFDALGKVDLSNKKVILNVAAQSIADIGEVIARVERCLKPSEILLEFGFQAYPTKLEDSGLNKIQTIRNNFSNKIVFADHVDGQIDDAIWLPVIALMKGVDCIEKHVMLPNRNTQYDHFSSLTPDRYNSMIDNIRRYCSLNNNFFVNPQEQQYLKNSLMIPFLRVPKGKGSCISLINDLVYMRSGKKGLDTKKIIQLQKDWHILANFKNKQDVLQVDDFKKATIATIIACRLKSSRLSRKAILPIGNLPSISFCLRNALKFQNVHHTILATSILPQDDELKDYTYKEQVIFHRGDPDDVIRRYLDICNILKLDVVIRVTGDNPFIDNEICQILLDSHFSTGADYTTAKHAAVGTNLEIISVAVLEKINSYFPSANYSEYMTWYFQNNAEHFNLNFVQLPEDLVRDYRLTLDHQEDLDMFNAIDEHFQKHHELDYSIRDIFKFLDNNPEISGLNSHISIKYNTDSKLIKELNENTKIR